MSPLVVNKIQSIADLSGRSKATIFSFCVRHALFIGAYKAIKFPPALHKDQVPFGTRVPKRWVTDLGELAWERDSTINAMCDYFCNYSLSAKLINDWASFFRNTEDIQFDFWMYIYKQTECQTSRLSYRDQKNTIKLSKTLKIYKDTDLPD